MKKAFLNTLHLVGTLIISVFFQTNFGLAQTSHSGALTSTYPSNIIVPKMTYGDVLRILGAPVEKITMEAKRRDIWIYDKQNITFHNGLVSQVYYPDHEQKEPPRRNILASRAAKERREQARQADAILKDIAGSD